MVKGIGAMSVDVAVPKSYLFYNIHLFIPFNLHHLDIKTFPLLHCKSGCVAKTSVSLVELAKVPAVARPRAKPGHYWTPSRNCQKSGGTLF